MTKTFNKIIAIFVALALVVSFIPSQAFATSDVAEGGHEEHVHSSECSHDDSASTLSVATPSSEADSLTQYQEKKELTEQGTTFPVHTIKKNVDDDQAVVIVIMGDGFTSSQQDKFLEVAKTRMEQLLRTEPYRSYANNINVYAMCVESAVEGVSYSGSYIDTYLGLVVGGSVSTYTQFRGDKLTSNQDSLYEARARELKSQIEENILTTSDANFIPEVSTVAIISNKEDYFGTSLNSTFSFSSLSEGSGWAESNGSCFVHEINHSLGSVKDEYDSYNRGPNIDSSSNTTAETSKWGKMFGFGGVGINSGSYSGLVIPTPSCLMDAIGNYCYGWQYAGWYLGMDALCEVCKLETARKLLVKNNVRATTSIYVATPEITIEHPNNNYGAMWQYVNNYMVRDYTFADGDRINNLSSLANGKEIEFRTVVQNVDRNKQRKLKLRLKTYDSSNKEKQSVEQEFTVGAYTDSEQWLNNRDSCQSLSVKLQLTDDYTSSDTVLGEVIEVLDNETEKVLATDKDKGNQGANQNVTFKYKDADSKEDIKLAGDGKLFLPSNSTYTVTYPSRINGYKYESNDATDGTVKVATLSQAQEAPGTTVTYYFKKISQDDCQHEKTYVRPTTAATCTATGVGKTVCVDCGKVTTTDTVIPAKGHSYTQEYPEVPATCGKAGTSAYKTCVNCFEEDPNNKKTTLPALSHEYVNGVCKNCGATQSGEVVQQCTHQNKTEKVTKQATCEEKGSKTITCNDCSNYSVTEEIAALGHDYKETSPAVEATCGAEGRTAVQTCSHENCNKKTIGGEVIAATGNHIKIVNPEKLEIPATCVTDGQTAEMICQTCKTVLEASTVIKARGYHTFVEGKCSECGEAEPKTDPDPGTDPDPDPKPETEGETTVTLVDKSNGNVTLDKTDYKVGDTAKVTIKGNTSGNNLQVVKSVKVNGITIKSQPQLLDKTTWAKVNDVYKNKMGGDPTSVEFENLATELAKGVTVDVAIAENTNIEVEFEELVPVYRLYNSLTSEHLFTTNKTEYDKFVELSKTDGDAWIGEGINWFAPATGNVVHRLYNEGLGAMGRSSHYYTADETEIANLLTQGWTDDGADNQFMSGGDISIWTCYNEDLGSAHHYTSDESEWRGLAAHGWNLEEDKNGTAGVFKALMSAVS
jgi:hypothetical protein